MKIHTSQHDWFGFSLPCWFHAIHSLTVSATSFHCFVLLAFLFSCPKCPMTESSSANTNSSLSFWSLGSPCFTSIFPARCSLSATPFCSDLNSISSPQTSCFLACLFLSSDSLYAWRVPFVLSVRIQRMTISDALI